MDKVLSGFGREKKEKVSDSDENSGDENSWDENSGTKFPGTKFPGTKFPGFNEYTTYFIKNIQNTVHRSNF